MGVGDAFLKDSELFKNNITRTFLMLQEIFSLHFNYYLLYFKHFWICLYFSNRIFSILFPKIITTVSEKIVHFWCNYFTNYSPNVFKFFQNNFIILLWLFPKNFFPFVDKPKVVSRSQSQKLMTWFSLKLQCPNSPTPGKFQRRTMIPKLNC